ncbi:MAG: IMP dehydrogenase [Nitrososphaerota archaeon]|nr:IMP dehydrogenase [Nitrososphaerota archaeon]MDG7014234.1 IMP dehydrogenase [Nitrososphaerota archaeon]MDG7026464.1 IMP dehydrogenase [Nitrososphaerota archaeon]
MPRSFLKKLDAAQGVFTFRDFILLPGRSEVEPGDIDLSTRLTKNIKLRVPLVSSPMDTVTEWKLALEMARLGGAGAIHRNMPVERQVEQARKVKAAKVDAASTDEKGRPLVGASVSPLDAERCKALDRVVDFLVADVAHFHTSKVMEAAMRVIPDLSADFIAGNIGTSKAASDIVDELPRVDGFRAGIGSGSICITSEVTRVGAPTLFAVAQVATAMEEKGFDIPIVADGGIRGPGDAALSFAAGASVAMLGSALAGTAESPSPRVTKKGKAYKVYRGMASAAARRVRFAVDRYSVPAKGLDEGVEAYVPYVGRASGVVERMENGLRAAFGYAGARSVQDMWTKAAFGSVSAVGATELGAHSVEEI